MMDLTKPFNFETFADTSAESAPAPVSNTLFLAMDWKRRRTLPTACVKKVAIVGGALAKIFPRVVRACTTYLSGIQNFVGGWF